MYVLIIEDEPFKYHSIRRVLQNHRFSSDLSIDRVDNLEDGIRYILAQFDALMPYDLVITDMWYPAESGGKEERSGEKLIEKLKEYDWHIPVILCSSVNYSHPDIVGSVFYSENENWESKLMELITIVDKEKQDE